MKTSKYLSYIVLSTLALAFVACEPRALNGDDVFLKEESLDEVLKAENPEGYQFYELNEFLDVFMTEKGNFASDTCPYRERSYDAGNFYKAMVIQQVVNGKQQSLRISVDLGSVGGLYLMGQEIIIRCNGLAVGRYANQPQLCVPSYNNNIYAMNASQKVGWCPGRIQGSVFRKATRMIGTPDPTKLQYDTVTLAELVVRKYPVPKQRERSIVPPIMVFFLPSFCASLPMGIYEMMAPPVATVR